LATKCETADHKVIENGSASVEIASLDTQHDGDGPLESTRLDDSETINVLNETPQYMKTVTGDVSKDIDCKNVDKPVISLEQESARIYIQAVLAFIPSLVHCQTPRLADEVIQEFSSKFFVGM